MSIYYFVYKTTHINGRYYIGRHQTNDLNDGYLGSGKWVKSIQDKSSLTREIVAEANSIDQLCELEEYYIELYWEDPLCMNYIKGSNGWKSSDAKMFMEEKIKNGTHPWQTRKDGTNINTDRVKAGTHQWLTRKDGTNQATDMISNGTHPWQTRKDGTNINTDRVKAGTHQWLTRKDGTNINTDRVKAGTHNFLKRSDGSSLASDRVNNGTNPFLNCKGTVSCYNKVGKCERIPKEQYHSQSGPMEDREWVHNYSKEGRRRKLLMQ